jgi:hypothetical protein
LSLALAGLIAVLGTTAAGSAMAERPGPTTQTSGGIRLVGEINTHCSLAGSQVMPEGVDPGLGVLVLVLPCSRQLALFSTTTGRQLAAIDVGNDSGFAQLPVDPVRHLVFLRGSGSANSGNPTDADASTVRVYSLTALLAGRPSLKATISVPANALALAASSGASTTSIKPPGAGSTGLVGDVSLAPTGAAVDVETGFLYLTLTENFGNTYSTTSSRGPGNQDVYLVGIDVRGRTLRWSMQLDECSSPAMGNGTEPVVVAGHRGARVVAVGCLTAKASPVPGSSGGGQAGGGVAGTGVSATGIGSMLSYSVPLTSQGMPVTGAVRFALGRTNALYAVADPDSGRIYWVTAPPFGSGAASDSGPAAVAYDPLHAAYVAAPTIGDAKVADGTGLAVGAAGGRLYAVGPQGIAKVDTSADGGQGTVYPGYSCFARSVAVDGRLRRLFVRPTSSCTQVDPTGLDPPHLLMYQDTSYQAPAAQPMPPDSYTQQVDPASPSTDAAYNGHTEATGVRVRLVGGAKGVVRGVSFGASHPFEQAIEQQTSAFDGETHELDLGVAHLADLDNYHAGASAAGALADGTTGGQVTSTGGQWPFDVHHEAACSAPGTAGGSATSTPDVYARVACDPGQQGTSAVASGGALGVALVAAGQSAAADAAPASMNIGRSEVSAKVWLDSHGIASQVDSVVHGIAIGIVQIESVKVSVLCHAHGVRGTASCDFSRQLLGVSVGGIPTAPSGCTDTVRGSQVDQGCGALQDALNAVYPPYLVFSTPLPDRRPGYVAGSPGGYQAVAQKEHYEHLQDSLVSYDSSLQIPGLEMLYVNDSAQSPSRLDVQLADVQSEARFGLSTRSSCALNCGQRLDKTPASPTQSPASPTSPTAALLRPAVDQASGSPSGHDAAVLTRVLDGLRWLLRTPGEAALVALTLALLTSPLGLAARRRRLDRLVGADIGATA